MITPISKHPRYFLAVFFVFMSSSAAQAAPDPRDTQRLSACIEKSEANAPEALEDGFVWRAQGGRIYAEQCIAIARIAAGEIGTGAQRLADLANASDAGGPEDRALLLEKAGNAWILVDDFGAAINVFDAALKLVPNEPDLLIDRARAKAGQGKWADAQADLTLALSRRPSDDTALRLRAETLLQQKKYDEADRDIAQALRLNGKEVDNWLVRGRIIEARRLGHAPD